MKAIQVRYLPATNTKGVRLKAFTAGGNQLTTSRDYELDCRDDARQAAIKLMCKLKWIGHSKIQGEGVLLNGDYVFTLGGLDDER